MLMAWLPTLARRAGRRGPGAALAPTTADAVEEDSRDVLQHAIDVARDGMAIYDRELRLVAWNRAYRELFAFPEDMLQVGAPLATMVRCNAERGLYGAGPIDEVLAARLEVLHQPNEGLRLENAWFGRVLEMRSVRLRDGGLFFTYSDATAHAVSEEELEAENQTLERRVRERTEELEHLNLELAQAKAEAEDANISKTRFLAAASHDLLQPLNAARLYTTSLCERLRGDDEGGEPARLADNVDASLGAVEDILGALLEITQIDAGATRVEITAVDLGGLLRQLSIDFAPTAAKKQLSLTIVPSSLVVTSDRRLLRRLLQNLISNALKYTEKGGVLVGVRRQGASGVRLDVVDSGCGIPANKQRLIFREFERLHSVVAETPGAGLGLSIVERLSHVLGHEVTLASKVGRGSRFSVAVPRTSGAPVCTVPASPAMTRQRSLDGLVVAAIDNEVAILRGMEMMLCGWDCRVAAGADLAEAQAALDALGARPDVIAADYHLDAMDGLDVIAALRQRYGPLPAVLITADRSSYVRVLAGDMDVRVLMKPLKPAALRSLLSQWRLLRAAD